ncbi:MAG: MFS transporter [Atopobiaceae bacterium]|nr:MFS transporter [Atopobiaceae bacterium]
MSVEKRSNLLLKVGLLSASMLIGVQMSISPAIPAMREFFSGMSREAIESITTVQNFSGFVFILACPWISARLGKKRSVLLALVTAAIAGMVPAFTTSYAAILISRLVFGAGVGLDCGLAMSMVGDFFEGRERAALMGVRSSCETIGNIACTTLAGALLGLGWQWCFLVYGLLLVPVALFALGVPSRTPQEEKAGRVSAGGKAPRQRLNAAVFGLLALYFTFVVCNCGYNVRISSVVTEGGFATASQSSFVISLVALTGMVCGLAFGRIRAALGLRTPVVGLALMAFAMLLARVAGSLPLMLVSALLAGAAGTTVIAFLTDFVGDVCPAGSNTLATSVMVSGGFAGASVTPAILSLIGDVVGDASATGPFIPLAFVCIAVAVLLVVVLREPADSNLEAAMNQSE